VQPLKNVELSAGRDKVQADLPLAGEGWTAAEGVLRLTVDGQSWSLGDQAKLKIAVGKK
jgi:hypothetical protein